MARATSSIRRNRIADADSGNRWRHVDTDSNEVTQAT
jgi:hypothetical protein